MTSFARKNRRHDYSRGVAAGFEDDSSGDEFMFGDDLDYVPNKKAILKTNSENSSDNKPQNTVSAPWLTNKEGSDVASTDNDKARR